VLQIWEETRRSHPMRRALALLDAAWPEVGAQSWASAPIGRRDACLVHLYEMLFGREFDTTARCPRCGERVEASFTAGDTGIGPLDLPGPAAVFRFRDAGYELEYRLPNSDDLLSITEGMAEGMPAPLGLVERCLRWAMHLDRPVQPADLSEGVITRLAEAMAEHDPGAEMRVGLVCPACRHAWSIVFDIVAYISAELDDWAQFLLADIHALALAYGWSERQILGLSPARRQLYLEMVRG
jgi:hypothetical protein